MNVDLAAFVPTSHQTSTPRSSPTSQRVALPTASRRWAGREFIGVEADAGRFALAVGGLEAVAS